MEKKEILQRFGITELQGANFQKYLDLLTEYNSHTNLVGKSTIADQWNTHILDSLQISSFIENKNLSILDMGTGAGFPGSVLSMAGFRNVTLIDSNGKKINFLEQSKKILNLNIEIIYDRIENLKNNKYDIVTSRALASLSKLLSYSQKFLKKNTVLVFLKGKTVNEEIIKAKQKWTFNLTTHQSSSDSRGSVIVLKDIKKND